MEDILNGSITKKELDRMLKEFEEDKKFNEFIKGKIPVDELFKKEKENANKKDL
jgi:hypothetical protein